MASQNIEALGPKYRARALCFFLGEGSVMVVARKSGDKGLSHILSANLQTPAALSADAYLTVCSRKLQRTNQARCGVQHTRLLKNLPVYQVHSFVHNRSSSSEVYPAHTIPKVSALLPDASGADLTSS